MDRTCKNCKSMCKYKVWTGIAGDYHSIMRIKQDKDDIVLGIYNGIQSYGLYSEPNYDSVSCKNKFSPFYNSGISKNNTCECWESKRNTDKQGMNVFDNYKCDGQLIMKFDNTNIKIEEEISQSAENIDKRL